jgi:acetyltransferase-like isoleucine patch superfamily enzyme
MHFFLKYFPFLWNLVVLKLHNGKYRQFPKILGFIYINGRNGKLSFGNNVAINSSSWANPVGLSTSTILYLLDDAEIFIGNNVGISNSLIYARFQVVIEDNVLIGGGCQILDNDFHSLNHVIRNSDLDQQNVSLAKIQIKRGAFIGVNSIILKGVTIGENSIIAAGSVVARSVPDLELWGGNPARFIRKL